MTVKSGASLSVSAVDANGDGTTARVVFYNEFKDKVNTSTTQYNNDLPPATLTLEDGATFTNAGVFAGTIVTSSGNVFGEPGAVWAMSTYEANGYALTKPYVVVLNFELIIQRPGYTWEMTDGYLVKWYRENAVSTNQIITQGSTGNTVSIQGVIYNTTGISATVEHLLVAVYDASNRMLSADMQEVGIVEVGGEIRYTFELPVSGAVSYAKAFVVGQGFVPLGPAA